MDKLYVNIGTRFTFLAFTSWLLYWLVIATSNVLSAETSRTLGTPVVLGFGYFSSLGLLVGVGYITMTLVYTLFCLLESLSKLSKRDSKPRTPVFPVASNHSKG